MRSAKEAVAYMKKVHTLVRYLEICDGNMQEGSFRCDANVSVRKAGAEKFGTRAEIKNLNSFRFVEKAINYEVERQIELLESGGKVVQETRLYDPDKGETRSMRSKEEANDYRYFPDPDLLPVELDPGVHRGRAQGCRSCRTRRPAALPASTGCPPTTPACSRPAASWRTTTRTSSGTCPRSRSSRPTGSWASWLPHSTRKTSRSARAGCLRKSSRGLLARIADDTISGKIAKEVFEAMWADGASADAVIEAKGLRQITDSWRHREGHRRGHGQESRRSSPTTAPARTSCSASSSARS